MANKYVQSGLDSKLFKEFNELKIKEDRSESKMGEILIREALAARRLKASQDNN